MAKDKSVTKKVSYYKSQRKKHPGISDAELSRKYKERTAQMEVELNAKDEVVAKAKAARDEAELKRVDGEKKAVERKKKEVEESKLAKELAELEATTTPTTTPATTTTPAVVTETTTI